MEGKWWISLILIAAAVAAVLLVLYLLGKKQRKKQDEQQAQIEAAKQTVSMLVIDKKKLRLKYAGFPPAVYEQVPKLARIRKFPIIKGKVGPRIATFIAEKDVYDVIPVKKEIKATISGLYITNVKSVRGSLETPKGKKKKESKFETLLRKGRGEI